MTAEDEIRINGQALVNLEQWLAKSGTRSVDLMETTGGHRVDFDQGFGLRYECGISDGFRVRLHFRAGCTYAEGQGRSLAEAINLAIYTALNAEDARKRSKQVQEAR